MSQRGEQRGKREEEGEGEGEMAEIGHRLWGRGQTLAAISIPKQRRP